ncbi:MAG: RDD family protein [Nocardioides sp.]
MSDPYPPERPAASYPVAGLDRRFYAFVVDRLIGWGLIAAASWAAYSLFFRDDRLWPGIAVIAGTALLVWLLFAIALGASGATPGKAAVGLRAVSAGTGTPIGVGRALLRGLVLGVATVPTFAIGLATLAWTALMDPRRQRRGWHDQVARSVVVDVRPEPVAVDEAHSGPRHVVNLTAMRLVPAAQPVPQPQAPPRAQRPVPTPSPVPASAPTPAVPVSAVVPDGSRTVRRPDVVTPSGPPSGWLLAFDTGERVPVDGLVLVGRRPEGRSGEAVRHLVALPSQDMSLSKTHAQVGVAGDGTLVVMDRGSTNGSVLIRQGVSRPLSGGKPATLLDGDVVRFGDRTMEVSRAG